VISTEGANISAVLPAAMPAALRVALTGSAAAGSAGSPIDIDSSDTESVRRVVSARQRRHQVSIFDGSRGPSD
jgi:hypothetical protein